MRVLRSTGGIEDEMLYGGVFAPSHGKKIFKYAKIDELPESIVDFPAKDTALTSPYIGGFDFLFNLKEEPAKEGISDFIGALDTVYLVFDGNLEKYEFDDEISNIILEFFGSLNVSSTEKGALIKKKICNGSWSGMSYYAINNCAH